MRTKSEARQCFKNLARQICQHCGVEWRKRFAQGKSVFEMNRYRLSVEGTRLELLIDVEPSVYKRFF